MRRCPSRSRRWRSRAFPRSRCASSSTITASARCSRGSASSRRPPRRAETATQAEVRPEPKIDRSLYETVTDEAALDRWIAEASAKGRVAFDTETDGRDCVSAKLVGISLATDCNKACYIPLEHGGDDMFAERPDQLAVRAGAGEAEAAARGPGGAQDRPQPQVRLGGARTGAASASRPMTTRLVMSFNLDAGGLNSHALDDLAKKHLDHECIAFKDLCGTGPEADHLQQGAARPGDRICRRGCRRRAAAVAALPGAAAVREGDAGLRAGRPADGGGGRRGWSATGSRSTARCCKSLSAEFNVQIAALEERICGEAGCKFTIGSPQQLGDILFNQMGLSGGRKGKSGTWSTDVTELERLSREGVPIAQLVLDWRQLTKLKSTYTDALQEQINRETGRVHTSYSLSGAQTGRLASTDPNLHEHPDPHRDRPAHPRRLHRRAGLRHALGRLQPDRAAPRRPYLRRAAAARRRSSAATTSTT